MTSRFSKASRLGAGCAKVTAATVWASRAWSECRAYWCRLRPPTTSTVATAPAVPYVQPAPAPTYYYPAPATYYYDPYYYPAYYGPPVSIGIGWGWGWGGRGGWHGGRR